MNQPKQMTEKEIHQAILNFEDVLASFENEQERERFGDLVATWIAMARACTNIDLSLLSCQDRKQESGLRTTQVLMVLSWLGDNLDNIKLLLKACQKAEVNLSKDFLNGTYKLSDQL
jgi:hypothetical protein